MDEQLFMAICKEPGRGPYIVSTFGHSMNIHYWDDLSPEISRCGSAMIGTKDELTAYINEQNMGMEYVFFVPLFRELAS